MDDLVSRQQAIDAMEEYFARIGKLKRRGLNKGEKAIALDTVGAIKSLPSAQPEIIYCGDCKYKDDGIDEDSIPFLKCLHGRSYGGTRINDFCSWAEKREATT